MGTKKSGRKLTPSTTTTVADALFTKSQQRVLGVIFGNPGRSFYANEIIARAGSGNGAVQRELAKLEGAGLVKVTHLGNQKHYQVNLDAPVFGALHEIVLKTSGLADVLRGFLAPISSGISAAFVYGSIAKGQDSAGSDIDLMVISDDLAYPELFKTLEDASRRLGRPVNPTVYSVSELEKRIRERNSFAVRVLKQPKIWLIGGEDDLAPR
ncbi:MAG: nucleotidyltransferase domain-containing protein [Gemmatimonadota bacterium]|nr:nucleotidyltransferase domain-containing protein [Gemmatimonadota bacterium]